MKVNPADVLFHIVEFRSQKRRRRGAQVATSPTLRRKSGEDVQCCNDTHLAIWSQLITESLKDDATFGTFVRPFSTALSGFNAFSASGTADFPPWGMIVGTPAVISPM